MSDDDEAVGYGQPPKATRFKKGQSGNPRGRPKGSRNLKTDVKATLDLPVELSGRGGAKTVRTQEAALLRLREKALRGDARSLDKLLDLARRYNEEEIAPTDTAPLSSEDKAILDRYIVRQLRRRETTPKREQKTPMRRRKGVNHHD